MSQSTIKKIGWAGTCLSVLMYVSYIVQIMHNLQGDKANFIQPMVAMFNCIVWTIYGLGSKPRDWPIVIANVPGIFLGAAAAITSF